MPDISMCRGEGCPIRTTCYRYAAEANPYGQSYAVFENICTEETQFNRWMCNVCMRSDNNVCRHVDKIMSHKESYGGQSDT